MTSQGGQDDPESLRHELARLIVQLREPVARYAARLNPGHAESITNSTLTAALIAAATPGKPVEDPGQLLFWLLGVVRRKSARRWERTARDRPGSQDELGNVTSAGRTPDEIVADSEMARRIPELLNEQLLSVYVLMLEDIPLTGIVKLTHLSLHQVRKCVSQIRRLVQKEFGLGPEPTA